jgi:hypothetical protein
MAIQIVGNGGVVAEVDSNHRTLRTTPRPNDIGSLGAYRGSFVTGTMAAGLAAASPIFSFRWTDATRVCVIRDIKFSMSALTGFTQGNGLVDVVIARSFTASDTGGASALPTGNNAKMKTSMGTTLVGDMRISTTATLVAGTRTLDTTVLASYNFNVGTTANSVIVSPQMVFSPDGNEWPLVLSQNEGFIVRLTVPATGTHNDYVQVRWEEMTSFP